MRFTGRTRSHISKADSDWHQRSRKVRRKTRILVLEEHPLLRDGMTDFLNAQPDMHGMR